MTVKEILDSLGIVDQESNDKYMQKLILNGVTDADVEVLNPENIDLVEFWTIAREIDRQSIVGGNLVENNSNKEQIITKNTFLYKDCGIFDEVLRDFPYQTSIIEYGCGYGPLFYKLKSSDYYLGIDLINNIPFTNVVLTDGKHFPPLTWPKKSAQYFVCINVFQHMCEKHIRNTLESVEHYLDDKGKIIVSFQTDVASRHFKHKDKDEYYSYTCGQLIPHRKKEWCFNILKEYGFGVWKYIERWDGFLTLYGRKI